MSTPAFRRVVRRETHSPRTIAMIIAVVVLLIVLIYLGAEIVLYLAAQPALLLGPLAGFAWLVGLPTAQPGWLVVVGGIALAVIGLVLIGLAVAPGRLPKHEMTYPSRAVVIDNGVIAAALAQHLTEETGIPRENITVGVAHRTVDVTVTPGPGVPLQRDRVQQLADTEMDSYQLAPRVKTRVRIKRSEESEWDR
ncbi:DUF6286 domain-containing protein [Agromyces sp. NPDC058484]|uniref:DUF6286 domain-containing protein n=1 Tax=Agromyces sp. NPDC058484 TaxID=3346524 RepID=UPI003667847D